MNINRLPVIFITLFLCSIATVAQQKRAPSMSSEYGGAAKPAERIGVLRGDKGLSIPLCNTQGEYSSFRRVWLIKNKAAMDNLIDDGSCFIVNSGTAVRAVGYDSIYFEEGDVEIIRVHVLQGANLGKQAWTSVGFFIDDASSSPSKEETESPQKEEIFELGETVYLKSSSYDSVLLFLNQQALEDSAGAQSEVKRDAAVDRLISTGGILEVQNFNSAVVSDAKKISIKGKPLRMLKVRVNTGEYSGKVGWVFQSNAIKK